MAEMARQKAEWNKPQPTAPIKGSDDLGTLAPEIGGIFSSLADKLNEPVSGIFENMKGTISTMADAAVSKLQEMSKGPSFLPDADPKNVMDWIERSMEGVTEAVSPLKESSTVMMKAAELMDKVAASIAQAAATNSNITIQVQTPDGSAQYDSPFSL
jgi:hypothetical protein